MNIAVFCSSSNHIADHYKQSAYQLGELIAGSGNKLVYGGATGGLMDAVAEGARSKNGKVIGVIAQAIIKMNRKSSLPTELLLTETLSERKAQLKAISDLFVVLPGSYGTLDEMLDVIASGVVGEHKKPLIIINQDGFYAQFINQIDFMRNELFIPQEEKYKPLIVRDIYQCMELINLSTKNS
ncbi:MAG: TIGR00730 family Rossman fold protein [Bacteroidota bacterium]|nr:TIGR00730 family Rossman fold protein [Bacteroidota bacterium]